MNLFPLAFGLMAIMIVLVVVLTVIGLVFTLPLSKIKAIAYSKDHEAIRVAVFIDGSMKATQDL